MDNKRIKTKDAEVIEVELNDSQIDKLIIGLKELKENQEHIHFDVNNKHLIIHYEGEE